MYNLVGGLLSLGLIGVALYGYVENVLKLLHIHTLTVTADVVLRIVGLFLPPLGVIMGYIN